MKEGTVDNKNIRNINVEKIKKDKKDNLRLEHSPSADYNHQIFKRKHTSLSELEKAKKAADQLLAKEDEAKLIRGKFIFERKSVSLPKIYCHLFEPIDWLYFILALIGSLGTGVALPLLSYFMSEVYSDIGNTSEVRDNADINEIQKEIIRITMNDQIKKQSITGAISSVCSLFNIFFWSVLSFRVIYNLKKRYFRLILCQEQAWFDSNNAFQFATKVAAQVAQIEGGIGSSIGTIISTVARCIMGFVFAFISSWKLTLVMLCTAPIIIFFMVFIVKTLTKGIILARVQWEKAGGIAEEMLYNIKTIASFANFEYELRKFNSIIDIVWNLDLNNACKFGFALGFIIFFLNLCIFIAFIYGRTLVGKEINTNKGRDFTGGDVMAAASCTLMGITGLGTIAPMLKSIKESCAAASDYFNLYERKPQMDLSQSIEKPPLENIQGLIEFKNVDFYYPSDPNKRIILDKIDLIFEPGKKVALVGESGCGKSTTVNLIERLYDINGGEILIDGLDIKKYDIRYLRGMIGYVQQEPVLFNNSIRDNLIFGREEQLNSMGNIDELINEACEDSYASEFINNLPEGLNYVVGIKGGKLSGGQKQRIAIARAILAKPKILILDEATSALDNKAEKEVQKALDNISKKNVTTIIIAHRLSTIKNADLIYACKNGKVLEKGTHKELLEKGGYYAGLVRSQLAQDEIETQNEQEEIIRKKTSIKRIMTDEEVHFEKKDKEICLKNEDVKVKCCNIFRELSRFKVNIGLAALGSAILGCLNPINGLMMAKSVNSLNSRYQTIRYDEGLKYSFIFLAFAFLQGIGNCLMIWKFTALGSTLARNLRKKLLYKYLSFHLSFFDIDNHSPGALLTRMSIDSNELNQILNNILSTTIQVVTIIIIGLALGCYYDYRITLFNFCFVPFIVAANILQKGLINTWSQRGLKANVEAGGILSECVINTKTIFSFNFQQEALRLYLKALDYIRANIYRDAFISGLFVAIGGFCNFASNVAVYALAKKYMIDGSLESEEMNICMQVISVSTSGITSGLGSLGSLKKSIASYRSVYSILETPSTIPPYLEDNQGKLSANNIKGKIEFRNVYFAYPTRPENVILKDVSFIINPGEQAAFVGYSGSGKSTIIQLISRFYDVEDGKGEILIDDINIKEYNLYELRKKIGLVSQEPCLFKVPVLENVRYGRLNATDEECIEAAREANIMKFFTKERMNEIIGNNIGSKKDPVSGGEKQRLAIARVFLKNPTILLLDEATSALDKDSELEVQKSIDNLNKNRTSISIAHRLSTIEKCDKIFVLENGRIVEKGTHDELIKLKRKYYILHKYSDS